MMHQKKTALFATGLILFIAAAVISVSIFSSFFSTATTPHNAFMYLGSALISVYGICALLIAVYLVAAGLLCFSPDWSFKRGFYLTGSIIPFFTVVLTEQLCRSLVSGSHPIYVIFAVVLVVIGAMLIIIEYFALNTLAGIIENIFIKQIEFKPLAAAAAPVQAQAEHRHAQSADTFSAEQTYPYPLNTEEPNTADFDVDFPIDEAILSHADFEPERESTADADALPAAQDEAPAAAGTDAQEQEEQALPPPEQQDSVLVSEVMAAAQTPSDPTLVDELLAGSHPLHTIVTQEEMDALLTAEQQRYPYSDEPITVVLQVPELYVPEDAEPDSDFTYDGADDAPADLYSDDEAVFLSDPFASEADSIYEDEEDLLSDEQEDDYADDEGYIVDTVSGADIEPQPEYAAAAAAPPAVSTVPESPQPPVLTKPPVHQKTYHIPVEGLLSQYKDGDYGVVDEETKAAAALLKETLSEFKIEAEVTGISKGPVITMFEILPAPGVKLNRIVALQDNIALRLAASSVRIVAPIPGKHAVGIEVPNKERSLVSFREIIEQDLPCFKKMAVPVVLGKDITGNCQIIDLTSTPHLLIAGATGAGKSVCVNSLILSILYKRSPAEVKLILIDPKIVELKLYNDIPHLLTPVITEPKRAFQSLQYCLCEMERRYALLDGLGVRDIKNYNRRIGERNIAAERLPYIIVIIDEFADLMATTGKELESTVARLAAMSRAVGIHLVLATQRPSIDVITGLIKANIPSRIAFMVASKTDSRIIIDQVGAEKLLGKGDMLYSSSTDPFPVRIQGTFVSDQEVENVVDCVKEYGPPNYIDDEIFVDDEEDTDTGASLFTDGDDPLYDKALEVVIQAGKASASYIQRRLKIGYNRAARLVEEMEDRGIVGPANGSKPRELIHIP